MVLAGGFGLGVAVMAVLLGVAAVILDQARAPELVGGGEVIIDGPAGRLSNPQFVLSAIRADERLAPRVAAAAPIEQTTVYLIDEEGSTPVRARGGIPSLQRAMRDREIDDVEEWSDAPADREWASPDPEQVLRGIDRFHPIPDVPARAGSWAEWLYFNGRSGDASFYLTFLAGPRRTSGQRTVGVRLQLERAGTMTAFTETADLDDKELLASAPDIIVKKNMVRLVGSEYRIALDLPAESGSGRAVGEIVVTATPGRSLPPLTILGAAGWVSGYVVPVVSGPLSGRLVVGGDQIDLDNGIAYHDHNWGFWEGVSWQWGQVHGDRLAFVYGRIQPPADAVDANRVPAFLMALGPSGPLGYATDVTIVETNAAGSDVPREIAVRARSRSLDVSLDLDVMQTAVTRSRPGALGANLDFLQLRAQYHATGRIGDQPFDFVASGSAETFRRNPLAPSPSP
jgi:hypothetical protein